MANTIITPPFDSKPITDIGSLYIYGAKISVLSGSFMVISAGQMRDQTNSFDIVIDKSLGIIPSIYGAGGLDSGVREHEFYAVYVLFDSTGVNDPAGIISRSSTGPWMPSVNGVTYSHYRLVGYVILGPGPGFDLEPVRIIGDGNNRKNVWEDSNNKEVLISGTSPSSFSTIKVSNRLVPSIMGIADTYQPCVRLDLDLYATSSVAGGTAEVRSGGAQSLSGRTSASSSVVVGVEQISQVICAADFMSDGYYISYKTTDLSNLKITLTSFDYVI